MIKLLKECLNFLNIPIKQGSYNGKDFPYITFFEVSCEGNEYSDDTEESEEHRIQVDFWTKHDPTPTKLSIRKALKKNFYDVRSRDILDGEIKHIVFDCYYYDEEEI